LLSAAVDFAPLHFLFIFEKNSPMKFTKVLAVLFLSSMLFSNCKKEDYECTYTEVKDGITYTAVVTLEKRSKKEIQAYTDKKYTCVVKK
jgi:hypothetical protein